MSGVIKKGMVDFLKVFTGDPIRAQHGRAQRKIDEPAKAAALDIFNKMMKLLKIEPVDAGKITQDSIARLVAPQYQASAADKQEVASEMAQLPSLRIGLVGRRQVFLMNTLVLQAYPSIVVRSVVFRSFSHRLIF